MRTRYFRYLFENLDEGLFHSGCIYDKAKGKSTNYIYMAGNYCRAMKPKKVRNVESEKETIPDVVDIMIVGGYTIAYIKRLIYIVKNYEVKKVILPYLAPIQRLVLTEYIIERDEYAKECVHFLQDPYAFLKEIGIEKVCFLYKNDAGVYREPEELAAGCHFEPADGDALRLIREMEGYDLSVVKAGYIIENGWMFLFGVYGLDLQILSGFTREYFSHTEHIHHTLQGKNNDCMQQMQELIQEYIHKFGSASATTVAMFAGSLYASPRDNDSFMVEKEFSRKERCKAWLKQKHDDCCTCVIRCMHDKDYDIMQHHKDAKRDEPRFGMMLLGNTNLREYLSEICERFQKIRKRIRGIAIPNCGNKADWNANILRLSSAQERIYWICTRHETTAPEVVNDIVLNSSNDRFLCLDKEMGSCISGYIVPKEEDDE